MNTVHYKVRARQEAKRRGAEMKRREGDEVGATDVRRRGREGNHKNITINMLVISSIAHSLPAL